MARKLIVIATRAGGKLGKQVCKLLDSEPGKRKIKYFADGEISIQLLEEVRNADVFIIGSTNPPAENWDELKFLADAARRASARRITLVIPYLGYNRQDRKDRPRAPISAKTKIDEIKQKIDRVLLLDLHSEVTAAFFDPCNVDHLFASHTIFPYLKKRMKKKRFVIASTDAGGAGRAIFYDDLFGGKDRLVIFHKSRTKANQVGKVRMIGKVRGETVVFIDDMIDTAGTLVAVSERAKQKGAVRIIAVATHALLSADAVKKIDASPIDELIVTDTVPQKRSKLKKFKKTKVTVLPVAELLKKAIGRIHQGESVSDLILNKK